MKSVYIESSVLSYLASRPSRDLRAAAWQQITAQWWERERTNYELFISELAVAEIVVGNLEAADRRLDFVKGIPELAIDAEVRDLAARLIDGGAFRPIRWRMRFTSPLHAFMV